MKTSNYFRSKLFALTLALVASVSSFAHDFFVDGIYYNILDDNNVEVTYKGSSIYEVEYRDDVVIPDNVLYNGVNYVVASIGKYAFSYSNVKSVIIGNNLTTIGDYAFYECYKLASVTLGNNVTNIEGMAFMYCKALKSITLPNITHIGSSAFNNCLSLDSVTLGNGLRNIADNLFYQCSSLTHITIPDSIECIGEHAFYNCKLLKTIYIPNTVNMIGKYAFSGCSSLDSIHIPNGVTEIGERTFENCTSLQAVNLPKTISSIRYYAFAGCASLTEINIPEGVQKIESNTFQNCTSLLKITIPNSVMTIELGAFSNTGYYNDANNWEEDVLYISNCLIEAKNSIAGDYNIKQGTRIIADYALYGCSNLTSVNFAESVKSVGQASFYNCTNLSAVNMSDSLQNIGSQAFAFCEKLNPIAIPVGVKTFGTEVFQGCKSLVSVIWNAKECQDFPYFYMAPFYRISSKITSITFGDEVEYIPAGMCYGLSAVPSITIPVNVKRIGKDAFESCTSMTSITWNAKHYCDTLDYPPFEGLEYIVKSFTFGEDIETIPPYVCKEMREITSITIPEGVKSIGRHAFNYCLGIPSVTIPKGVTTIGSAAFFHTYIESIIVPEGVTEIGGWAFSECYSLNKIELPSTLKSIGNSAFKETYYIDTLICKAVVPPAMGELPVFEGIKKERTSLFVPEKSIELYQEADQWKEFGQILPIKESFEDLFPTLAGLQRTTFYHYTDCSESASSLTVSNKIVTINDKPYLRFGDLFLREENNRVLIYSEAYDKDLVLYDWNLEVGDSVTLLAFDFGFYPEDAASVVDYRVIVDIDDNGDLVMDTIPTDKVVVDKISTITLLDGKEYKMWHLATGWAGGITYVEGIGIFGEGYFEGDYFGLIQIEELPACYYGDLLVCITRNGQLLYQMDDAEMERLGAECLCEYNNGPKKDNAKDGKIGGRPTPTQWNMLEMVVREMENNKTILLAETFSYTLEDNSRILNNKTYFDLARQSTRDTAITKSVVGALHFSEDEGNRVYFLCDGMEYLLYDFTAEPGDSIEIFAGINNYPQATTYTHVVTGKDTLENGACRMILEVVFPNQTGGTNLQKVWLAGLGSLDGIVHNSAQLASNARSAETESSVMLCAWREDDCLYTTDHPDFINVGCEYNVLTAVEDIQTSGDKYQKIIRDGHLYILRDGKIYDVLGTPLN